MSTSTATVSLDKGSTATVGDTVRIFSRSRMVPEGPVYRVLQPGIYVIARANRHGDWTVRDTTYGTTHDVFRNDVMVIRNAR